MSKFLCPTNFSCRWDRECNKGDVGVFIGGYGVEKWVWEADRLARVVRHLAVWQLEIWLYWVVGLG
jgi:hypothetical protein